MRGIHCSREGAVLQHPVGKRNHLEIKMKSFLQLMKKQVHTFLSEPSIPPFSYPFPFYCLNSEGGNPLGMEKASSSLFSLPYLVKSLSQESHIEFILLACVLCY